MSKILFIPRPLPEESPTSILKRMAIMHGCILRSDLRALFGRTYFNGSLISRSHPIIQEISKRAGAAGGEFLSGFYEPVGALHYAPPLKIAGLSVSADMIRKRGAAYCSECWKNGKEHFIKDLKLSSYCPYHLRKYLSKCPNCQVKLYWHALDEKCRCNHLLVSPPCSADVATIEQKLLDIFRAGDAQKFRQLNDYLNDLGYRLERDTECPANRCLLAIAFALVENDMVGVLAHLRKLRNSYPKIPAFIIAAKLSSFSYLKIRDCVRDFIKYSTHEHGAENGLLTTAPLHSFSLTKRQIGAWLNICRHHWKTLRQGINIRPDKARYNWQQAQALSRQVLVIKLRNGFKKKKARNSKRPPKNIQEKLQLSADAIKGIIEQGLLTPKWGRNHKMYFDSHDIDFFSKKFISVKLLSSKTKIPTKQIRKAIAHLKIAPLNFANSTLRLQLISTKASQSIIEWNNEIKQPQRKPYSISRTPIRYIPTEEEIWLSTAAAAEYLDTWIQVVRHLIKFGLLTRVRKPEKGGGYLVDARELKDFKAQYVSATEACKLLGCSRGKSARFLKNLGIPPVTGPKIDHNPSNFYLREKISLYISTGKKSASEDNNRYTVLQASEKLQLPTKAIFNLIEIGALQLSDSEPNTNHIIKCSSIDSFYTHYAKSSTVAHWLKTRTPFIYKPLKNLGIAPLSGTQNDDSSQLIYAIEDIAKYFSIPNIQKLRQSDQELNSNLINVSNLWKKYDISGIPFGRLFLTSGFTNPIRIGVTTYLLQNEALNVEKILEKYYTFSQADRYLGHKHTRNLTKRNKLDVVYPLKDYLNYPMLDKIQLHLYAANHGFV